MELSEYKVKRRMLEAYGKEPENLNEVAEAIIADVNSQHKDGFRLVGFSWNIEYNQRVSNTHSRPIRGVTNFSQTNDRAKNYPGWSGRLWVRYNSYPLGFGSDPLQETLIHPGSGGAGGYDGPWERISTVHYRASEDLKREFARPKIFSWDCKIFLEDFPLIEQKIEVDMTYQLLRDVRYKHKEEHAFIWEDPKQKRLDQAFIEKLNN